MGSKKNRLNEINSNQIMLKLMGVLSYGRVIYGCKPTTELKLATTKNGKDIKTQVKYRYLNTVDLDVKKFSFMLSKKSPDTMENIFLVGRKRNSCHFTIRQSQYK